MTINTNDYVTPATFAAMKHRQPQTVYGWIRQGKVNAIYIDNVPFINKNATVEDGRRR